MTVQELILLREKEDRVEFKEAKTNFSFAGGEHSDPAKRRKCILGYVVALANEGGGISVEGHHEKGIETASSNWIRRYSYNYNSIDS